MKRFNFFLGLLAFSFFTLQVHAQVNNGTYRALTTPNSARVAALGGLPLPMHDGDLQTVTFNPSAICPSMNNQAVVSYVGDFNTKTNYATLQYSHTFDKIGSFAGTLQYHNYGEMPYVSESGYETGGTFGASDYAFTLGWGRELTDKWSIGANLKFAALQYETDHAGALAVDVAATYWSYSNWALSLTARNIGMQIYDNYQTQQVKLPFSVDFVASKKLDHLPLTVVLGFDDIQKWNKYYLDQVNNPNNYDAITGQYKEPTKTAKFFTNLACHLVVGGELEVGKNLVLRAAYNYGKHRDMTVSQARTLVGFSAGFGIKIKMFEIDYSRSRNNIVGSPNYLTLRVDMSKFNK